MRKLSPLLLTGVFLLPVASPAYATVATQPTTAANTTTSAASSAGLTYQQAIDQALRVSKALQNANAGVDRSREVLSKTGENVQFAPLGAGDSTVDNKFTAYAQADINHQISQIQVTKTQDQTALSVRQAYNAILTAEEKKKLDDISLQDKQLQKSIAQYSYQAGAASDFDNKQADAALQQATATQQSDEAARNSAYQLFDQLVGLQSNEMPKLAEQPEYQKLENIDLESYIVGIVDMSPDIEQLNKAIDISKLNLNLYHYNDPTNPDTYQAKQIDVSTSATKYADAKDQLAKSLRSMYALIRQREDQYDALQAQIASLQNAYRIAKVQYDVGTGTKANFVHQQYLLEQAKEQLYETVVAHDNLVNTFKKPWAASGGSSSGSQPAGS